MLQLAAVASTHATLTCAGSKHLCQRGTDRDSLRNVLGALISNLIVFKVDACQRGADGDALREMLGVLIIKLIVTEIDVCQQGTDTQSISNCLRPFRSMNEIIVLVTVASNVVTSKVDLR